ncbi:MAG TPA: LPS export ABC transporter periplasmic protein LptC [Sphaerochaeta sp.]|nr:LPS export ABC transporter periplasmic protein LptC [Sphaerochaeta sp.]
MIDFLRNLRLPNGPRAGILRTMSNKGFLGMILALFVLSLSSCTMETQIPLSAETYDFPDISLMQATYVLGRSGESPLTITADEIAIFEKTNQAKLKSLQFSQLDQEGEASLSGRADSATVNTKTYDAQLFGNILVTQKEEDFTIEAEQLLWLHDEQILQSTEESTIRILFDGGQTLEGRGFKGNLKTGTYEFTKQSQGVLLK